MVMQTITLSSREHFGQRVPAQGLGSLLEKMPEAVRQSVRMAVEGRSRAKGKRPDWLRAAADIRFLRHEGRDQTILHFEAPTLGEAAPRLYEQKELWPTKPDASDTGIDVLADVFRDVAARDADSERFDRTLLDSIAEFRKVLNGTFTEMVVPGRGAQRQKAIVVTRQVVEIARTLYTNTPLPQRVLLVGKLDMIRASTQSFGVLLDDDQEVRGVLVEGDIQRISPLLNQRVLVVGKAVYRASGRLLRVDADDVTKMTEEGQFFSAIPKPVRQHFDIREAIREQQNKLGVAAIIGKWPGNETEDEIRQALRDLN
jgi:hypothetical protein